jgi:hypothetical protein
MSTSTPAAPVRGGQAGIRIVSHSNLFYWWPVWAVGFLLGLLTLIDGARLAAVPDGTKVGFDAKGQVAYEPLSEGEENPGRTEKKLDGENVLIAPAGKGLSKMMDRVPHLHITRHKSYGVVFATVLLLVVVITNIPLRGLWSVIVIVVIVALVLILALMGAWEHILRYLGWLDIRITMGGYFFISGVLLGIWLIVFLFFDQQVYMVFSPGQFRVRLEIGEGETAYDTTGMTLQKVRSDLFRHWILGLGSGDLVVRTSGAQAHQFELHNVLFVGPKLREIEEMLRARAVVAGRT